MKALVTVIFLSTIGFVLADNEVATAFKTAGLKPDIVDKVPTKLIKVSYGEKTVNLGNELTPTETASSPKICYNYKSDAFYTLILTGNDPSANPMHGEINENIFKFHDPDVPSRVAPALREYRHWHVGNIPGNDITAGDTLATYMGPAPPIATGFHRYTFLLFEQCGRIDFNAQPLTNLTGETNRTLFSTRAFSAKYNLGNPIAGNYFRAQFDG